MLQERSQILGSKHISFPYSRAVIEQSRSLNISVFLPSGAEVEEARSQLDETRNVLLKLDF